jgi:hypothetical protein
VSGPLRERADPVILSAGSPFMERLLQMNVSDQKITSRFPVGYHSLRRDIALNFQLNRF